MLPLVKTKVKNLKDYQDIVQDSLIGEIKNLSRNLQRLRVLMINSTPRGGGVAEVLKGLVPLMKGIGIEAEWHTIPAREKFFKITKKIHNLLQGKGKKLTKKERDSYLNYIEKISCLTEDMKADIWVIHDPQPVGLINYLSPSKFVWRAHLDLTSPKNKAWNFISSFLGNYKKIIVSSPEYLKKNIKEKGVVFPPGIDPLALKNQFFDKEKAKIILRSFGISTEKPLVSQVSRFDYFKDPLGVIAAYKKAKKKIPSLQLALVGFFLANDDPQAVEVYEKIRREAKGDSDIFLFANINMLSGLKVDTFVNAIQTASNVVVQKSLKEGFGLTVTEAMWRKKAVIGGNVGGIKMQIENGRNGFLVERSGEAARRIVQLIENPKLAEEMGKEAKASAKENFLIPRVLRDYLRVFKSL